MPAFSETYSRDQRATLFRAAIDQGLGVRGALDAATASELPDLQATEQKHLGMMSYGYACELVKDERVRRGQISRVRDNATETAHQLAARLLALADREIERLEQTRRKSPVDTDAAIRTSKLVREAIALSRTADEPTKAAAAKANTQPTAPGKPTGLAARIAARPEPEHTDDRTAPHAHSNHQAPATNPTNHHTTQPNDEPVRLSVSVRDVAGAG